MKIGLVGCGQWGKLILRDLVSLGCKVQVVAFSEASKARAVEGGAESVCPTPEDLANVDGIVVATPTSTHIQFLERVVPRRVPIFVEKPLGTSSNGISKIEKYASQIFVMDKWRYHRGIMALRDIRRSGEFGKILSLKTWRTSWGGRHSDTDAVWHLMPHELAITLEILGFIPAPRAAAVEKVDGLAVSMTALFGMNPWVLSNVSERSDDSRRRVSMVCEKAVVTLADSYADHLEIRVGENAVPRPIEKAMPLLDELRCFVGYLSGGPPPKSSFKEGLMQVKAIEALVKLGSAGMDPENF